MGVARWRRATRTRGSRGSNPRRGRGRTFARLAAVGASFPPKTTSEGSDVWSSSLDRTAARLLSRDVRRDVFAPRRSVGDALTKAVADGKLDQRGQSFAIPGLEFDEPEDEKVIVEVLDEGQFASSSGRCEAGDQVIIDYVGRLKENDYEFDRSNS